MKILLTGGAGFIGSHLGDRLLAEGHDLVCLDNFDMFYDPDIKEGNIRGMVAQDNFELVRGSILDRRLLTKVFSAFPFDVVVHLAALAGVRPSMMRPGEYARVNVEGATTLLDCCRNFGVSKMVFASSSSVYGNNPNVPFREDEPLDKPVSPYAATKKASELMCYTYHHLYDISVTCLRYFTVYGPRQRPDMAIHKFTRLMSYGREIPMFGDGSSSRDYTFVDDIVTGTVAAIERCQGFRIYNLGESQTIELKKLIELIAEKLGVEPNIKNLPFQPGDVQRTCADVSRACMDLDYKPTTDIETGIGAFVEWYKGMFPPDEPAGDEPAEDEPAGDEPAGDDTNERD